MRSRTINDLLAAQSDLLKSDFQTLIDSSVRISELSARVANDAANKINERSPASLDQARRRPRFGPAKRQRLRRPPEPLFFSRLLRAGGGGRADRPEEQSRGKEGVGT